MKRQCFAKINLTLDSLYQRPDGYHEIDSIMARISLFDELIVNSNDSNEFNLSMTNDIGSVEDNLIYKVWYMMKDMTDKAGVDVKLQKNIPLASGLAGGSTDAAEMIKILNVLWNLDLTNDQMIEIGSKLGADIPFFFTSPTARVQGIGEKLIPFENKLDMKILVINDGTEISSAFIYEHLPDYGHIDNNLIVEKLENADDSAIFHFENVMEDVITDHYPHLLKIKEDLVDKGAEVALISGSGASIIGIFMDDKSLDDAYIKLKNKYNFVEKVSIL